MNVGILDVITMLIAVSGLLVAIFNAPAEKKKLDSEADESGAEADESRANAVKLYQEVAANVQTQQREREKEWNAKLNTQDKEIADLKSARDIANNEIAQLRREVNLTQVENAKLQGKIDELEKEATNYRTAIATLLHENGALKEWCERLVKQFMRLCPGVEPEPFVKNARTNE